MDDVENSVGKSAAPYEELMECRAAGCGVFGGFPDDRIARQEGRHDVPGGHRDRKIASRNDGDCADWPAEGEQLLVGHFARHGLAVKSPALSKEEVAGVDDLPDFTKRFAVRLADLGRHQPRECLRVVLDKPADMGDRPATNRRGYCYP